MRPLLALAFLAGLSATAVADPRADLVAAINNRDTKAVEALVDVPLRVSKLRFDGDACGKYWGVSVLVRTTDLEAFVGCLAAQKITTLASGEMVYGPGFRLGINVNTSGKAIELFSTARPGTKALLVHPDVFLTHVKGFTRVVPATSEALRGKDVGVDIALCVNPDGTTQVKVSGDDLALASYRADVETAAGAWTITPFEYNGKPTATCGVFTIGTSESAAPPPSAINVKPQQLQRLRGNPAIVPDKATKQKIGETAAKKVIGMFKLCLSDKGLPSSIDVVKPTGYDAYDQRIMAEMKNWAYEPFLVKGKPMPVCTSVAFIYKQD